MKKELMFLSIFFTLLILTSFANAKILVSEPEKIYNLGDKLYLTVTTKPASVSGFFEIKLVCNNESLTIERFIANRFKAGEEQKINIELPLTPQYIQQMRGDCYILASISDEEAATKTFLITDKITIKATLDKKSYDPGETITLKIEAIKANNEPLEGFVEASGIADFSKAVVNGMVTETFTTPETTEAGNYDLNLFLYDIANNQILNHANKTLSIKINQVPQFIQISLSKLEAIPGENFSFGADIFDQAGKKMSGAISISIISPDGEEKHMTINSGEIGSINLATNATAGTWKILASFENVNEEKDFVVKPVQRAKFSFSGPIFTVKNIGNCPYNKTIEIIVGGKKIKKEFSSPIPIGEERKFKIKGPKGEQEVIVSDGSISEKKIIPLTGDVISISELKGPRIFSKSILWAFIILVLLSFGSIIFFRFKNKSVKLRDKIKLPFKRQEQNPQQKQAVEELEPKSGIAESSLVLKGEKNKSAVVCIKLKNKLGRNAKEELIKILEIAKRKKGMIDFNDDYVMIVFSPLTTKTFANEILAVKSGFEIFKKLKEYNKKFRDKIEFNIGINSGDLISSIENKKLKYTSIGGTILLAKKISDLDTEKILISDEIRKKLMKDLKVKEVGVIGQTKVYSVLGIVDKKNNEEKLHELLRRMQMEENFNE